MLEQEQSEDYSYYVIHNYHSNFAAISCIKATVHKLTKKGDEYQQAFSNSDAYRAVVYRGIAQVVAIVLLIAIVVIELPFIAERFANLGNIAQAAATSAMGNYHKQAAKDYARERDRIQDKLNRL